MTRILAVEDSATQAELLRFHLATEGFEVRVVPDGPEALRVLEREAFDLVLSDVVMPGMDGYQLCRLVKDDPRTRQVPVVLLTSLTDPLDVVRGLEAGADNFIRKPYQPSQLIARLRSLLQNRDVRRDPGAKSGVRLSFLGRDFDITAERQQILDLLVSTFEELVVASREVRAREEELSRAHDALEQQLLRVDLERNRLQAVVDAVPVPLFVMSPEGIVTHSSGSLADLFGVAPERFRNGRIDDIAQFADMDGQPIATDDLPHRRAVVEQTPVSSGWAFDVCLDRGDGSRPPVMFHASPVLGEGGEPAGCVGTLQVLGQLGRHDSLTGLPNRVAFLDRAARIPPSRKDGAAVLLIELDRFEAVRTALGSDESAAVVAGVSRRLRQVFETWNAADASEENFLAHLEGVQFGIILVNLPDAMGALRLAEAARRAVSDGTGPEVSLRLTASVGVAVGDVDLDIPKLVAAGRAALQRARDAGGDRVELFGPAATQEEMDRLHLETDLRAAVASGDITLAYQPEFDLASGELLGFEALARWHHSSRGPVAPDTFIRLAEEGGLIIELGRQLLTRACRQAQRWTRPDREHQLSVSVNVSAVQLRPRLLDEALDALAATGLDPTRLVLEVTETAAMGDPETTLPVLGELRGQGIRIALDDFGTGYSSMAYLTRINFDQLKLDRSFVSGMGQGRADAIVAQSIVALGHSLGVPVLAEGVEREDQARDLAALGCDQVQGYLYGRPIDEGAVEEFIDRALHTELGLT